MDTKEHDIIKLNVGGVVYTTTRTTLCQPGSWFESMFSGKMKPSVQVDGAYFIDRDGKMFKYILDYMRNLDRWLPPVNTDTLTRLVNEADYFCLQGMTDKIKESIPITHFTFEVYIKHDEAGEVKSVSYCNPPPGVKDYLDSITINKESYIIHPPKLGLVQQLINKIDGKYELYSHYTSGEWMTLLFRIDPKRISLTKIQEHLEMFTPTK